MKTLCLAKLGMVEAATESLKDAMAAFESRASVTGVEKMLFGNNVKKLKKVLEAAAVESNKVSSRLHYHIFARQFGAYFGAKRSMV